MDTKRLGIFGEFVKQYEKARRPYPLKVFKFLKKYVKVKNPQILDLGCGTGISSRQLTSVGTVTGCDPDVRMLRAAKGHKGSKVKKYVVGFAKKLPFKDESFDVVTAFSSFHWFDDVKSHSEIQRVLKPGGVFFVVGKEGIKKWGEGYRSVIIKTIEKEIAHFKTNSWNSKNSIKRAGFAIVMSKQFKMKEYFDVGGAVQYVESVSIWNSVPKNLRIKAKEGLKKYFRHMLLRTGKIERKLTVKVALGIK